MVQGHRIGAVLLMGGEGLRFGSSIPKQFLPLGDKKVYEHALGALKNSSLFDEIVIVCHPKWAQEGMISGGKTRQESSYLGLQGFRVKPDIVLIHDAVRPFVSKKILEESIAMAVQFGAVDTCIPSTDTLVYAPNGEMIKEIPNRASFYRGQTPQAFQYQLIVDAHEKTDQTNASDDCQLILPMGKPVHLVCGSNVNIKITTEIDIIVANAILNSNNLTH